MSTAEIEAAIIRVKAVIQTGEDRLATSHGGVSSYSVGGRQVSFSDSLNLERAYKRLEYLEALLLRAQRGGGIPVRWGVVAG